MQRESPNQDIKSRLPLSQVIGQYLDLKTNGREKVGLCPFHNEKSSSFFVNDLKGLYYCFGCHASGDHFTFLMEYKGMPYPEALEDLAKQAGVDLSKYKSFKHSSRPKRSPSELDSEKAKIKINKIAGLFFKNCLASEVGRDARAYLLKRGLTEESIEKFKLGFAPDHYHALEEELKRAKAPLSLALDVGLLGAKKSGEGHYDTFRLRIIYPIFNEKDDLIAFGGRTLDPNGTPKYLNSKESSLFNKSDTLYGINFARRSIRERQEAILTEGYMDVISLHQVGITNAVAALGTSLTENHLRKLKKIAPSLVLLMDGDEAGVRAAERTLPLILKEQMDCRIVILPDGKDADDLARSEGGKEELETLIRESNSLIDHLIEKTIRSHGSGLQNRIRASETVLPWILQAPGSIAAKTIRIRDLSDRLNLPHEDLLLLAKKLQSEQKPSAVRLPERRPLAAAPKRVRPPRAEMEICRLLFHTPALLEEFQKLAQKSDLLALFSDNECRSLAETALKCGGFEDFSFSEIQSPDLRATLARSAFIASTGETQANRENENPVSLEKAPNFEELEALFLDALTKLEIDSLIRERKRLSSDIRKNPNDPSLIEKEVELSKQIHHLKTVQKKHFLEMREN